MKLQELKRWYWMQGVLGFCLLITPIVAQDAEEEERPIIVVNVVDSESRPIPTARVSASLSLENIRYPATPDFGLYGYHPVNKRGRLVIDGYVLGLQYRQAIQEKQLVRLTLRVVAPGYVPCIKILDGKLPDEITITLQKGRTFDLFLYDWRGNPFTLRAKGDSFEGGTHIISTERDRVPFQIEVQQRLVERYPSLALSLNFGLSLDFGLEPVAEGHYRFTIPEDYEGTLLLAVEEPKLSGYFVTIDPKTVDSNRIEVRLPKPSRVTVEIDFSALLNDSALGGRASVSLKPKAETRWFSALWQTVPLREKVRLTFTGVAPGEWELTCWSEEVGSERTQFTLEPNETKQVTLTFQKEDIPQYRGERTVTLEVVRAGGVPYANQPYRVEFVSPKTYRRLRVAEGTLDEQGKATLHNLYEYEQDTDDYTRYLVYVGDQMIGNFVLFKGDDQHTIRIVMPPSPGEPAPDVTLVDLATGKKVQLSQFRGKWVYLEFWATWCGPCQTALQELKEILAKYHHEWKDRLQVITVSLDEENEVVRPHLERRGWWEMALHTWNSSEEDEDAGEAYGVRSIPTAFLMDPEGKVVWRGNPIQQVERVLRQHLSQSQ